MFISALILVFFGSVAFFPLVLETNFSSEQRIEMGIHLEDMETPPAYDSLPEQNRVMLKVAICCSP
jgi:hypothetical protein